MGYGQVRDGKWETSGSQTFCSPATVSGASHSGNIVE